MACFAPLAADFQVLDLERVHLRDNAGARGEGGQLSAD